jgi:hypothetical protein
MDLFARNLKIAGSIKKIYNTNLDLENKGETQGVFCKPPLLLPPSVTGEAGGHGGQPMAAPAARATRSTEEAWNWKRRTRGTSRGAHQRRTRRETIGFGGQRRRRNSRLRPARLPTGGGGATTGARASARGGLAFYGARARGCLPTAAAAMAAWPRWALAWACGGRSGLGRATGSAQSGRVVFFFFRNYF